MWKSLSERRRPAGRRKSVSPQPEFARHHLLISRNEAVCKYLTLFTLVSFSPTIAALHDLNLLDLHENPCRRTRLSIAVFILVPAAAGAGTVPQPTLPACRDRFAAVLCQTACYAPPGA